MSAWPDPSRSPFLDGCFSLFAFLIGVVLLLPGLCSLLFIGISVRDVARGHSLSEELIGGGGLIVYGLLIGAVGVLLIWAAWAVFRRPRP